MKTIEDHAIDIFKEYPNIPMQEMFLRLFVRIKIVPLIEQAISESTPEISNVVLPTEKDTLH